MIELLTWLMAQEGIKFIIGGIIVLTVVAIKLKRRK